jgi:hypothetical protein
MRYSFLVTDMKCSPEFHPLLLPDIIGEVIHYLRHDLSSIFPLLQVCKVWKQAITERLNELILTEDDLCLPPTRINYFLRTFSRIERLELTSINPFKRSVIVSMKNYLHRLRHLSCRFLFIFNHPDLSMSIASLVKLTSLELRCKTALSPSCCTILQHFSKLVNLKVNFIVNHSQTESPHTKHTHTYIHTKEQTFKSNPIQKKSKNSQIRIGKN